MPIKKLANTADPLTYKPGRDVLAAVGRYHYLTGPQVLRLLYKPSLRSYCYRWLNELTKASYLYDKNWLPKAAFEGGQTSHVWSLTRRGKQALQNLGQEVEIAVRDDRQQTQYFMWHTHAVNDVLISVELLQKEPGIRVLDLVHERTLKRYPVPVTLPDGTRRRVVLDGFGVVQSPTLAELCLGLEVDCGSEKVEQWRAKIRALIALAESGAYRQAFGYDTLVLAICVRPFRQSAQKRMQQLLAWTAEELTSSGYAGWDLVFRFTDVDPAQVSPFEFWFGQHWRSALNQERGTLVAVAEA